MSAEKGQIISQIAADSLAQELGIQPGDRLLRLDGQPVLDVFDYQVRQLQSQLVLTIETGSGELLEFDIEKDEDEDLGLVFDNPLLSDCTRCHNRCIFCFIDQLPPGLRKTLYFKDDDMRMSFLHGNYVTLTNITDQELDRIISYRFSPMNISVHATDPEVRKKMMRNRTAGKLMERLRKLANAGISLNCQLVLCPGINDGTVLDQTIRDLSSLGESILSIAMVPVGITRYRQPNQLYPVRSFSRPEAAAVIETVNFWQQKLLVDFGRRTVYAGDEFYLRADYPFPQGNAYEDYPQLENGVGMVALMQSEMQAFFADSRKPDYKPRHSSAEYGRKVCPGIFGQRPEPDSAAADGVDNGQKTDQRSIAVIVTGTAAFPVLSPFVTELARVFQLEIRLIAVTNDFFGDTITVVGLLTGSDLIRQLKSEIEAYRQAGYAVTLVLPECMLKADQDIFLDDLSLKELADELKCCILAVPETAEGLINGVANISRTADAPCKGGA